MKVEFNGNSFSANMSQENTNPYASLKCIFLKENGGFVLGIASLLTAIACFVFSIGAVNAFLSTLASFFPNLEISFWLYGWIRSTNYLIISRTIYFIIFCFSVSACIASVSFSVRNDIKNLFNTLGVLISVISFILCNTSLVITICMW